MKKTTRLKKLIYDKPILNIPAAPDPLCGRIAEMAGFKAIFAAGYAESASYLAKPDISLLSLTEMVDCARRLVAAVDIPVMADGDTGHGNVSNVIHTIKLHEQAGVAGIFIEDQVYPKRCGHMSGKQVIPAEEMAIKLQAALDARQDADFIIGARTDALAVNGMDDAIARAKLYASVGVDFIFVEAPVTEEEMRRITREINLPTMANMVEGGKTPLLSARQLEEIGYALVVHPVACTYMIAKAAKDLYETLYQTGTTKNLLGQMVTFDEFNKMIGLPEIRENETKYYSKIINK